MESLENIFTWHRLYSVILQRQPPFQTIVENNLQHGIQSMLNTCVVQTW